ncbi:MAG: hypothetical protein JWQ04_2350 [Pedosphaera sp.]|nr:hypothetical protein [Pedosphaera sp.]
MTWRGCQKSCEIGFFAPEKNDLGAGEDEVTIAEFAAGDPRMVVIHVGAIAGVQIFDKIIFPLGYQLKMGAAQFSIGGDV